MGLIFSRTQSGIVQWNDTQVAPSLTTDDERSWKSTIKRVNVRRGYVHDILIPGTEK